jgi:Tfp pilus assembly PilM family ATPase
MRVGMNTTPKISYYFHDKPLFGLDIGHGSLKVMQLGESTSITSKSGKVHHPRVIGYGFANFDKTAQQDGVVVKPEIIAAAAKELFDKKLVISLPAVLPSPSQPTVLLPAPSSYLSCHPSS